MRLFMGLAPDDAARQAAAAFAAQAQRDFPGRYVPPANYHVTLAFLGDVPQERVQDAVRVLQTQIARFPAPHLTLVQPGFFGRPNKAILILRAQSDPALLPLHDALLCALAQADLPFDDGPFSPHMTLARFVDLSQGLPSAPPQLPVSFTPQRAQLYLSARSAQNVLTYTPIADAAFECPIS